MQMYPEEFPPHRRGDPLRGAEARVFTVLQALDRPGFAYYEWQRDKRSRQLDFALWIEGVGRFGLEVKGGWYVLIRGVWYLKNRRTGRPEPLSGSPLEQVSDATMSLYKEVTEKVGGGAFFTPTLLFPDLAPDPAIAARAERSHVHLIWANDNLPERLAAIAAAAGVRYPPTAAAIRQEVLAVSDGQLEYAPGGPARLAAAVAAPQVIPAGTRLALAGGIIRIEQFQRLALRRESGLELYTVGPAELRDQPGGIRGQARPSAGSAPGRNQTTGIKQPEMKTM